MTVLRYYQRDAVDAVFNYWQRGGPGSPLISMATGAGKSLVAGEVVRRIAQEYGARVVVATHRKELIAQDAKAIRQLWPDAPLGIYSAGLGSRRIDQVSVVGIQSVWRKPELFGSVAVVVIDECFVAGTKVLTPRGMIDIDKLRCGDTVTSMSGTETVHAVSVRMTTDTIIVETTDGRTIECTENHPFFTASGWKRAGTLERGEVLVGAEDVSALWRGVLSVDKTRPDYREDAFSSRAIMEEAGFLLCELRKEMPADCFERCGNHAHEKDTEKNWTPADQERRERAAAAIASACITARAGGWMASRGSDNNTRRTQERRVSERVQGRHSEHREDDRNRDRRREPRSEKRPGRKEGHAIGSTRVASVSRVKRKSPIAVFNLHVSGHPSYFANGLGVHNCHLVSPDESTTYAKWLAGLRDVNPDLRLVGLTATPFRMGQGLLTEGDGRLFDCVVYQSDIMRLVQEGFLSPLVNAKASAQVNTDGIGTSNGDFIARDLELAADLESVNAAVARDVADQMASGRKGALVFCCGVAHAGHMRASLQMEGVRAEVVVGETQNRDAIISAYKARELPCIVSCDVLTTGFDAPHTDVLAVVRPTQSPGLYVQIMGRGMRIADGKRDCVVLDYGGNIARHGPITDVRARAKKKDGKKGTAPTKICEHCLAQNPASAATCLHCDAEFPLPEKKANAEASELDPMAAPKPSTHDVGHVSARVHTSKEKGTRTLAVSFLDPSWQPIVTQYVCLEHDGYARSKAEQFWSAFFHGPCPTSCDEGAEAFKAGRMRHVETVTVKPDGKYRKLVSAKIVDRQPGDDVDDEIPPEPADKFDGMDEIPF